MPRIWPESTYLPNDEYRFVYCPIPKVASSSLKQWFLTTLGYDSGRADWPERPHEFLSQWLHDRRLAIPDDYLTFAFVRDPRRRLVSAFLQKFVVRWDAPASPARPVIEAVCTSLGRPVDHANGISFRCFVKHVVGCDPILLDPHWRPQYLFLEGGRSIDFVGRAESFDTDMLALTRRLGLPYHATFRTLRLPYANNIVEGAADMTSGQLRRLKAFPAWPSFYDDDLRSLVAEYYGADFRRFGYAGGEARASREAEALSC
ncbi:MAG TPA: sulfotransferase family protein [Phycisphaerae bacterium]|nr:sulfotransferase family protein [Phycisphaerae bacterium]HRW54590.1 sulfotransferase family protein [Phycisphaerae bacterium]